MTKIPEGYRSSLSLYDTQKAIEQVKNVFLTKLCAALKLSRVTAPLIVDPLTGMNDNLNGVEHPVAFDLPNVGKNAEVVQSLAKWKRYALWRYNFAVGRGLVCDMNAIRRDEQPDNLHSIYVGLGAHHYAERAQHRYPGRRCLPHCRGNLRHTRRAQMALSAAKHAAQP